MNECNCGNCRFYLFPENLCRRFPAQVVGFPATKTQPERVHAFFPTMMPQGWCGEHRLVEAKLVEVSDAN